MRGPLNRGPVKVPTNPRPWLPGRLAVRLPGFLGPSQTARTGQTTSSLTTLRHAWLNLRDKHIHAMRGDCLEFYRPPLPSWEAGGAACARDAPSPACATRTEKQLRMEAAERQKRASTHADDGGMRSLLCRRCCHEGCKWSTCTWAIHT